MEQVKGYGFLSFVRNMVKKYWILLQKTESGTRKLLLKKIH